MIVFNEGQLKALDTMTAFLKDKKELFLCLSGRAGTGKTTILKEAIKGYEYSTAITAPTHKAKKVVAYATKLTSCTIHSLLGLRPDMNLEDFDNRNVLFSQNGNNRMSEYDIICIDESSMLNKYLLDNIKKVAKECRTKVLFMGDENQLAPVKEIFSPVFFDSEIKQVNLDKVERQKEGNPLLNIYDQILSDLDSPKDLFTYSDQIIGDTGAKFFNSISGYGSFMNEYFFDRDICVDSKILCFYNDSVRKWNNYVRKYQFGSMVHPLSTGEFLMSYNSIYDLNRKEFIIQNASEYKVLSTEFRIKEYFGESFKGFDVSIYDIDNDDVNEVFIIDKSDVQNVQKFVEVNSRLENIAKERKDATRKWMWKNYYDFKNNFLIIGDIKDNHGNLLVKKDFDFSYALTIHKSQGSTYKNIFMDNIEINTIDRHSDRNRLKYVALSRPTNMAYINC